MKTMRLTIILVFLLFSGTVAGQRIYNVNFRIDRSRNEKFRLIFYYGDRQIRQDSAFSGENGDISFRMGRSDEPGMYRLESGLQKGLDFIYNKENVSIRADNKMGLDSIIVEESEENRIFFDYYRHKRDLESRIEVLDKFLELYPPVDSFYHEAAEYTHHLSSSYQHYLDSIQVNFSDMLVTSVIRLDQLPDIRPGEMDPREAEKLRGHYFDSIDLTDSLILNTPYLPVKVIDYLSLFIKPGVSKADQEKNFMQAVDSLMKFTEGGAQVREMIVNYLIDGFQSYGFESVMTYLVENYVLGQKCVSDQQEEKLKFRVEGFKKIAIGSPVPDFEIADFEGKLVRLSDNGGKNTLLIFWAGTCPHCEAAIPELKKLYDDYSVKTRFIGVSVDQKESDWRNAIVKNAIPWTNIAELKGWDGTIVQEFYVYATPTFLLIDKDLKVIAKPTGLAELKGAVMN